MWSRWVALLLLALAVSSPLLAQTDTTRPSHKPVRTGLENELTPEQRLAGRLRNSRLRKDDLDKQQLDDSMKALAKKLLEDPELLESLRKSIKPEDINRFKNTIEANRDLANDPTLRELVKKSMAGKTLTDRDKELIQRWKDTVGQQGKTPPTPPNPIQTPPTPPDIGKVPPTPPNPGQTPPRPAPPPPSNLDRPGPSQQQQIPDWLKKNLDSSSRGFTKWLDSPSGKSMRDSLRDIAKRTAEARPIPKVGERVRGVSQYLPKPGNWMLDNIRPRSAPRFGSLPRVSSLPRLPSGASMPRVSAGGLGKTLLIVATIALLLFLLWRTRGWWQSAIAAHFGGGGRLGPWPVRPDQITTRGDLVRAFEYLALLCLGPMARTHHHLDLGRLIGEQPSLDPDRRREAAETLARLYEQARYTPDDEPLSPEGMADARRELSLLAGEQAA